MTSRWSDRARRLVGVGAAVAAVLTLGPAPTPVGASRPVARGTGPSALPFRHVGSFDVVENLRPSEPIGTPTSAEIVDVTDNGRTLVYTDSLTGRLGVVDIRDAAHPRAAGALDLPGDPTSVAIHHRFALVAVVTSVDPDGDGPLNQFDAPTGELVVIDLRTRQTVRTFQLAGQPDSIAIAPSRRYAAIVIENERDEDDNDGLIPQSPGGSLQVLDTRGPVHSWSLRTVDLTGVADVVPQDPEPEYVDINARDEAVVSMQENNHLAIVDLRLATVIADFSAGTVDVDEVDTVEDDLGPQGAGIIALAGSLDDRRREPDAVAWIDTKRFVTANEGDYVDADGVEGGSRGFTIFDTRGRVQFESGNSFEHAIVAAGHYPESRSENKGNEPEGLEVAHVRGRTYLFVASERANAVGVYEVSDPRPKFLQLLPTAIGPEGLRFVNGLLAVTSETDGAAEGFLARPIVTLFQLQRGAPAYPQLRSITAGGLPIPWVAMSGLAGDPHDRDVLWAVSDSVLAQAYVYRIDVSRKPATITDRIAIGGVDVSDQRFGDYDFEGVAARPEGGFWFASEGRTNVGSSRANLIVRTDATGRVLDAVKLPSTLVAAANSSGFEGIAVTGTSAAGDEVVWVVIQREWADDPAGFVKVGRYDVGAGTWTFAHYPLDPVESPAGGFVGLSELTALADGRMAVVERDNQLGFDARIKRIYAIDPEAVEFAEHGAELPVLDKVLLADVFDVLDEASISVPDKLEGLGVSANGHACLVTDNDGVDENYGETVFLGLGRRGLG
jgi:Esterase-like activity of phytase